MWATGDKIAGSSKKQPEGPSPDKSMIQSKSNQFFLQNKKGHEFGKWSYRKQETFNKRRHRRWFYALYLELLGLPDSGANTSSWKKQVSFIQPSLLVAYFKALHFLKVMIWLPVVWTRSYYTFPDSQPLFIDGWPKLRVCHVLFFSLRIRKQKP